MAKNDMSLPIDNPVSKSSEDLLGRAKIAHEFARSMKHALMRQTQRPFQKSDVRASDGITIELDD